MVSESKILKAGNRLKKQLGFKKGDGLKDWLFDEQDGKVYYEFYINKLDGSNFVLLVKLFSFIKEYRAKLIPGLIYPQNRPHSPINCLTINFFLSQDQIEKLASKKSITQPG